MTIMRFKRSTAILGVVSMLATSLTVMPAYSQGAKVVKADGSSTVFPITEAAAADFQKTQKSVRVTVGTSGTGGGFKKFCRGEIDIANASRPILQKEIDVCKKAGINYIEIPVAFDGITVVVNPANNWAGRLTTAELKKIWEAAAQGKIKNWNQVYPSFPNQPIKLFGPGTNSGTFDYFTEAINGKAKSSRGDYTASEDDNVLVQGVSRDKGALGYFGYAYYAENQKKVKAVAINNVLPSEATIKSGKYNPLSRPLFIYVSAKSAQKPEVKAFVENYIKNGAKYSKEAKYVSLPSSAYTAALAKFRANKVGTVFGGKEEIGASISEILRRTAK
jgi:phosphate transport system substrate-binding protein